MFLGDFYVNTTLNAVVEIFGSCLMLFAGVLGRKPVLFWSFLLAGLFCIASVLCNEFADGTEGTKLTDI